MPLPYYKRYTRDILDGTVGMGFELKTSYSFILDLIYHHNGSLADEPRYIAGQLECSVRKWNNIRQNLIDLGKIQIIDGFITNYRAVSELESLGKFQKKQSLRASKPRKNKGLTLATVKPKPSHTDTDTDTDTEDSLYSGEDKDESIRQMKIAASAMKKCLEIAGDSIDRTAFPSARKIKAWLFADPPCLLEEDILPAIAHGAAKMRGAQMKGWNYFEPIVLQFRDERLQGIPKPQKRSEHGKPNRQKGKQSQADLVEARRERRARLLERRKIERGEL